jgi:hypothetical protein
VVSSSNTGDYAKKIIPALPYTDYVIINEVEVCHMWNLDPRLSDGSLNVAAIRDAMQKTMACGVGEKVVIHAKEAGFCLNKDGTFSALGSLKIPSEKIAGSVGAGDAFCAGCLYSIYRHESAKQMLEFATAAVHNSFYFVQKNNCIHEKRRAARQFEELINAQLKSRHPKSWFLAYFNHGLINYIYGQKRLLPCDMSFDTFFLDPYGDVMPCNGTEEKLVMGNLNSQNWEDLWCSPRAEAVRRQVRCCRRNCWMIGSASPAMHKYIWVPGIWVAWHKLKSLVQKKPYRLEENRCCRCKGGCQ